MPPPPKIQLLSVPDCPLVAHVRSMVKDCLAKTHLNGAVPVEELVGEYHSPTLLVDGVDVTGRPVPALTASESQAACRRDVPSEEQILVALRGAGCCGRVGSFQLD